MTEKSIARAKRKDRPASSLNTDRLPPHSIEAEQGVLGCIFLSPGECMAACQEKLKMGSLAFYDLRHQIIYGRLLEMNEAQKPIDMITVTQTLKDTEELEQVGGLSYVASLPDIVPSAANLGQYVRIVLEKFYLRRIVQGCARTLGLVYEHEGSIDTLLNVIESEFSSLTESVSTPVEEPIRDVVLRVTDDLEQRHYNRGSQQLRGLPTGPAGNYLDKLVRGIRDTYYVVLAGRPGSGKTSLAMNLVEWLAMDYEWFEEISAEEAARLQAEGKGVVVRDEE